MNEEERTQTGSMEDFWQQIPEIKQDDTILFRENDTIVDWLLLSMAYMAEKEYAARNENWEDDAAYRETTAGRTHARLRALDLETRRTLFRRMLVLDATFDETKDRKILLKLFGLAEAEVSDVSVTAQDVPETSLQTLRPKSYIMQMDSISNRLAALRQGGALRLDGELRMQQPATTTVTLQMPDSLRIEGGALNTYDKSTLNGVTTLLENGNRFFTIPMLYHAMTGRKNPSVDADLYSELAARLDKMRRMTITIDIEDDVPEESDGVSWKLEGYLLPLNKFTGIVNGRSAELYQIIQTPPLYDYSRRNNQLATVRMALLGSPVNNNSTTIPLKTYLLQCIEQMKIRKDNGGTIFYSTIYDELCAIDANKTKKMRIREYTQAILAHLRKEKYIHGFFEYRAGRVMGGIDVLI